MQKENNTLYFLEHNETKKWLCVDGTLTDNPNHELILSNKDKFNMDDWLKPFEEQWESDYFNTTIRKPMGQDMLISVQCGLEKKLALQQIFLYKDFTVTEHEFINNKISYPCKKKR